MCVVLAGCLSVVFKLNRLALRLLLPEGELLRLLKMHHNHTPSQYQPTVAPSQAHQRAEYADKLNVFESPFCIPFTPLRKGNNVGGKKVDETMTMPSLRAAGPAGRRKPQRTSDAVHAGKQHGVLNL